MAFYGTQKGTSLFILTCTYGDGAAWLQYLKLRLLCVGWQVLPVVFRWTVYRGNFVLLQVGHHEHYIVSLSLDLDYIYRSSLGQFSSPKQSFYHNTLLLVTQRIYRHDHRPASSGVIRDSCPVANHRSPCKGNLQQIREWNQPSTGPLGGGAHRFV